MLHALEKKRVQEAGVSMCSIQEIRRDDAD